MENNILQVEPKHELKFRGPFHEITYATIKLKNLVDEQVCFKIKTTAPKQYCVRPTCGTLKPRSVLAIQVLLQPFQFDPKEPQRHKFLVQSIVVPRNEEFVDPESFWKTADPSNIMETKLKCVLESGQDKTKSQQRPDSDPHRKYNFETARPSQQKEDTNLVDQLNKLREENIYLKKENIALREAGLRQRVFPVGGSGAPLTQAGEVEMLDSPLEPFADASIRSVLVMSFILLAVGFLIAKTIF